mgnify:CR=1 FL=1
MKATVLFYFIEKTACVSRRQFLYSDDLFDGGSGFASQAFFCLVQRVMIALRPFPASKKFTEAETFGSMEANSNCPWSIYAFASSMVI